MYKREKFPIIIFINYINKKNKNKNKRTDPRFARNDALPDHQIDGAICTGLGLSHKTLIKQKYKQKVRKKKIEGFKININRERERERERT